MHFAFGLIVADVVAVVDVVVGVAGAESVVVEPADPLLLLYLPQQHWHCYHSLWQH